jgi:hypothetical protein
MQTPGTVRPLHLPKSASERAFEGLRKAHQSLVAKATTEDDLPAWFIHTASGPMQVRWISWFGPFLEFVAPDETIALVAPEALVLTLERPTPETPRHPIGFRAPSD